MRTLVTCRRCGETYAVKPCDRSTDKISMICKCGYHISIPDSLGLFHDNPHKHGSGRLIGSTRIIRKTR